ncbi:nucleoside hydrolase [Corynebacterium timonense]|uniref:Purine nucleosidase n=1 Tax=Corynebacterium timonense TaxID=441500 RepID=A0A1H1M946_9CORY|nr:nucleoside hydrolase [Corynebacterium timonense]SDR83321.1 purine nucleosidase [Corynebacterium timonense]
MHHVIIDCDPGHDDAVALLLAAGHPAIDLLGVTTVGGNHTLGNVTRNARQVLTLAGRSDVPLHAGASRPLLRAPETAAAIHGDTGMTLHGYELPEPAVPVREGHAVHYIIDTIMGREPGTVTLVAIGPLTNIALAVRLEPRIVGRVREIVLMGGAYGTGNRTASAEFNIAADPEAAQIVFRERWSVTMVGLDLTHQALATPEVEKRFAALGTSAGDFLVALIGAFRANYRDAQGFPDPPVHDPCALAYLIDPAVVGTVRVPVDVETRGDLTAGRTVADFRAPAPADCHTQVATTLNPERFWDLVVEAVRALGE